MRVGKTRRSRRVSAQSASLAAPIPCKIDRSDDSSRTQMAEPNRPQSDSLRELAVRIYVELMARSVTVTDASAKLSANPENVAKVSFKLAEAFERAERELRAATQPKNQDFDLRATDLTGLMSTRPD